MKLFTKEINEKLFKQYPKGNDLENQVVVAKIFNPYGKGRWFLINSDPSDSDYLWAIVQMGDIVEVGSVSRKELESLRVSAWKFPLERDLSFRQMKASEVLKGLEMGKHFDEGGEVENENKEMVLNQVEGFEHHADELEKAVKKADEVPAWVVAKSQRASTDLSDITHYLDGENEQNREKKEGEEYADGGMVNLELNLKVKQLAQKKGFVPQKLGRDYELNMAQAAVVALGDANFHSEAKKLVSLLEKEPWSDELYKSEYYNPEDEIDEFGREVSKLSGWDGSDIADAFIYILKMNGQQRLATMIDKAMEEDEEMASGGYMAKGGKTESEETVYIEYLNKSKKFAKDRKEFKGQNGYMEAISWGRKNIPNFNADMVKFKMGDGGYMAKGGNTNDAPNIRLLKWYKDWLKNVNEDVHVFMSIPNEISFVTEAGNNNVILDFMEKAREGVDAKKYLQQIVDKADELGVTIYLQPQPRPYKLKSDEHKKKITKDYLVNYFEKFGFEKTSEDYMVRKPKMADGGILLRHKYSFVYEKMLYTFTVELNNSEDELFEFETMEQAFRFARKEEKEGNRITDISKYKKVGFQRYEREQELLDEYKEWTPSIVDEIKINKQLLLKKQMASGGMMEKGGVSENLNMYIDILRSKPYEYDKVTNMHTLNALQKNGLIEFTYNTGKDTRRYAYESDKFSSGIGGMPRYVRPRDIKSAVKPIFSYKNTEYFIGYEKGMNYLKFYVLKKGNDWDKYNKQKMEMGGQVTFAEGGYMAEGGEVEGANYYELRVENYKGGSIKDIVNYEDAIKKYHEYSENGYDVALYAYKNGMRIHIMRNSAYFIVNKINGEIVSDGYINKDSANRDLIIIMQQEGNVNYSVEKIKKEVTKIQYAMGGEVKFADKVKSIKKSLLERKKVSPKVQKDYGKTYSPKEAEESAKRIVGAMTARERLKMKTKKYSNGGLTKSDELRKKNDWEKQKIDYINSKLKDLGYTTKNSIYKKWINYLNRVNDIVDKLINSGITENGKYEIKYSFTIDNNDSVRASVLLPINFIFDNPKNEQEWKEKKNKYENRNQYVAYKIGEVTKPILGFPLCSENSFEKSGSYVGGMV